jgi:hypothetical protein
LARLAALLALFEQAVTTGRLEGGQLGTYGFTQLVQLIFVDFGGVGVYNLFLGYAATGPGIDNADPQNPLFITGTLAVLGG